MCRRAAHIAGYALPEIGLRLVLAGCGRGTWFRAARGVGRHEAHEVALAWAAAGLYRPDPTLPPFRSPHHSASMAALIGGGSGVPVPGEVVLAHRAVS